MQERVAIIGAVIFPTFESVDTFSPDQFLRFVQDEEGRGSLYHYELLDGRIHMTPPAGGPHGVAQGNLFALLSSFVRERKLGRVYGSSAGYRLPSNDVVEPDIAFVSNERHAAMPAMQPGQFLRVVPDLMMEVLSPSHEKKDLVIKRAIYEKNGVREYWIADPRKREVQVMFLDAGRLAEPLTVVESGTIESRVLPGMRVPVAEVFAD
jgi:Uma2 family endonuclease